MSDLNQAKDSLPFTQWAGAELKIDLSAIAENYRRLQKKAPAARCAAVVKADGYNLGMIPIAKRLKEEGCSDFFVAYLDEGLALRSVLSDNDQIYILHGLFPGSESICANANLIPILNSLEQIDNWIRFCNQNQTRHAAGVQLDSGMSRFGIGPDEIELLCRIDWKSFDLALIMSHLACADIPNHPLNFKQLQQFRLMKQMLPPAPASLSASSGVFLGKDWHFDLIRPGAALYGINPTPQKPNPMQNVVTLLGKVIQTRKIKPDIAVGYGASFVSKKLMRLALVSIGYADGFLRSFGNKAFAKSQKYPEIPLPIIGRISMDSLCIDISELPEKALHTSDFVELIGPNCPIDHIAATGGTIGYEMLTALGNRYQRIYY